MRNYQTKPKAKRIDEQSVKISQVIGLYVQGQEAKEKFWQFTCPCGVHVCIPLNKMPEVDTNFPCGDPTHWIVKYGKE